MITPATIATVAGELCSSGFRWGIITPTERLNGTRRLQRRGTSATWLYFIVFSLWEAEAGGGAAIPHPFEGVELLSLHRKSPAPGCKIACEGSAAACAQPLPPQKSQSHAQSTSIPSRFAASAHKAIMKNDKNCEIHTLIILWNSWTKASWRTISIMLDRNVN